MIEQPDPVNSMGNAVILTATVQPNVSSPLAVADPAIRLEQYRTSIATWELALRGSAFALVVVETSGATRRDLLSKIPKDRHGNISCFSYEPNEDVVSRGKGAIELEAIVFAINRCKEIVHASTVYKCTGRLALANVKRTIEPLDPDEVRIRMTVDRSWADTRLIGASAAEWRSLRKSCSKAVDDDDGRELERVVAGYLSERAALQMVHISRFPVRPRFQGVSGTSGNEYRAWSALLRDTTSRPFENVLVKIASRKQV